MARKKVTVVIDQDKLKEAQRLSDSPSKSATIDLALDRLIREEELRNDIEAYTKQPPTDEEIAWANMPVEFNFDDDDVDYDALYAEPQAGGRDDRDEHIDDNSFSDEGRGGDR
jgi:Arc/MetJ family transcription regulator